MGALLGLTLGLGLLLVWSSLAPRSSGAARRLPGTGTRDLLEQAGVTGVSPFGLHAAGLSLAIIGFLVSLAVSQAWPIALVFGALAANCPRSLVRSRRRSRRSLLREAWPAAVDNLASAVRAGLSLPEALTQLTDRGPVALRPAFAAFGEDFRATGRFELALNRLKDRLADPVGDRIVETLRLAREVGGSDLGLVLRTLSAFLREDARARGELESRQSWTVNGARMAVAAPWLVLGLLSLNPAAVQAYNTTAGLVVLVVGAIACLAAYRLMLRVGRLPEQARVLG